MSEPGSTWKRVSGKGLYPPKLSWALLSPLRNFIFSPRTLIHRLGLAGDWTVLELGSGPGYFSPFVARALASGHLHVVDVQEEMVARARRRLEKYDVANADTYVTDGRSLPCAAGTFDCAFLVTVLGEIEDPSAMLAELHRTIRPGGLLSITELAGDPDSLTLEQAAELIEPFGFSQDQRFGRGRNFTANFRKI